MKHTNRRRQPNFDSRERSSGGGRTVEQQNWGSAVKEWAGCKKDQLSSGRATMFPGGEGVGGGIGGSCGGSTKGAPPSKKKLNN